MSGWVDGLVCSWLWVFDVFRTFVFRTHGGFTALSTSTTAVPGTSFAVLL